MEKRLCKTYQKRYTGYNRYKKTNYKKLIFKLLENGIKSKACFSNYFYAQVYEYGYFGVAIDKTKAKEYYERWKRWGCG